MMDCKKRAWQEFISHDKPWGKPYKAMTKEMNRLNGYPTLKKADGTLTSDDYDACQFLLESKFPGDPTFCDNMQYAEEREEEAVFTPITEEEIANILKKTNNRSTPGIDKINYKTVKILNKKHPQILLNLYNNCLKWGVFP